MSKRRSDRALDALRDAPVPSRLAALATRRECPVNSLRAIVAGEPRRLDSLAAERAEITRWMHEVATGEVRANAAQVRAAEALLAQLPEPDPQADWSRLSEEDLEAKVMEALLSVPPHMLEKALEQKWPGSRVLAMKRGA